MHNILDCITLIKEWG